MGTRARVRDRLRGTYYGGGMTITTRRWWSPQDRKMSRFAATVLEHEAPKLTEATREAIRRHLVHGESLPLDLP